MCLIPSVRPDDGDRRRAVERELRGRHHARAELVLQAVHLDVPQAPLLVARLDVEEREAVAAGRVALGTRERERHLRRRGAGEPLRAVQTPSIPVAPRDGLADRDVGAAGALGHPLPARPRARRIAAEEAREGALDELAVAVDGERLRGAVGHRERAGVDLGRPVEEVRQRELMNARELAVLPLVRRGDDALLGRDARRPRARPA